MGATLQEQAEIKEHAMQLAELREELDATVKASGQLCDLVSALRVEFDLLKDSWLANRPDQTAAVEPIPIPPKPQELVRRENFKRTGKFSPGPGDKKVEGADADAGDALDQLEGDVA